MPIDKPSSNDSTPKRGRPRETDKDERILRAALELLRREGYDGMSVEAVARAAGVTRPTVYRRWPTKEDLATAAVHTLSWHDQPTESDDPWRDLERELAATVAAIARPNGMAFIGTLLAEEHRTPTLIGLFRERVVATRRSRVRAALERAAGAGCEADLDLVVNMLLGTFYAAYLAGTPMEPTWTERAVELLRNGIGDASGH